MAERARPKIGVVGLAVSLNRPRAREAAGPLSEAIRAAGGRVKVSEEVAAAIDLAAEVVPRREVVKSELVIVLGGDGTLLHTAGLAAPLGVPVLGVDLGSFGFLAECQLDCVYERLDQLLAGRFDIDERPMLRATASRGSQEIGSWTGLNDAVVGVTSYTHLVRLGISLDGVEVALYTADGIIVSTATGSTGYSLSAGGPIVDPQVDSFTITLICPHTLQSRPLVVSPGTVVTIDVKQTSKELRDIVLNVDGEPATQLLPGDHVVVRRAEFGAKLVRTSPSTFYTRLRDKLNWGLSH